MGNVFASVNTALFGKAEIRILMVGLDSAGKTSILYRLKLGEVFTTYPTIAFNVETIEYKNINFVVGDFAPREIFRPLCRQYYEGTKAVIFVVDSKAKERLAEAREELKMFLEEEELRDAVLLVFANKQDLPEAMSTAQVSEALGLEAVTNRKWHILGTSVASGAGLCAGLDWLSTVLSGGNLR